MHDAFWFCADHAADMASKARAAADRALQLSSQLFSGEQQ
jgi:hypothetical protein